MAGGHTIFNRRSKRELKKGHVIPSHRHTTYSVSEQINADQADGIYIYIYIVKYIKIENTDNNKQKKKRNFDTNLVL